jgi:hypothetical protein
MDDSFKFSQVTKTLLSILEDELISCTEEEKPLLVADLENLDKDIAGDNMVESLKR